MSDVTISSYDSRERYACVKLTIDGGRECIPNVQ
jgi:hypothetical protein